MADGRRLREDSKKVELAQGFEKCDELKMEYNQKYLAHPCITLFFGIQPKN